ncbi:transglutaminase domain-containing protein [Actinomyces wuliandei]|uniref:transglutaminase domain-containing protein n=1 Tax=Actinomyces wuliandei TaxID=2057743 RepID=UPI00111B8968|nr:transglutaminase domain-containing protein [Actinomyces wuliandei]
MRPQPSRSVERLRPLSPATRVLTEPGRWQPLLAALLVTALWWVGARAVEPVLLPGAWQLQVLAVAASALLVPGAVRSLWPSRPALGLTAGLASAACVLLAVLGWSRASVWWQDPAGTARLVGQELATGVPPLEVSAALGSGLLTVCLLLSWACALVSAGGADVVGLTGLVPAAALLVPVVVRGQDPPRLCLAGAALCLTALVVTSAPARYWPSRSHDPGPSHGPSAARRRLGLVMGTVAVVVATALTGAVPVVTGQGWAPARTRTTEPELGLTLSRDLLRGPGTTVLSYMGDLEAGTSLRLPLAVIADLEGASWGPERRPGPTEVSRLQGAFGEGALTAGGAVTRSGLSASDLDDLVGTTGRDGAGAVTALRVRVQDLSTDHLPVLQSTALVAGSGEDLGTGVEGGTGAQEGAASPSPTGTGADLEADVETDGEADPEVDLGAWRWVEGTSTATSGGTLLGRGMTYTLLGWNAVADASGQSAAQVPVTSAASRDVLERYTRLPADTPDAAAQAAREALAQAGAGEDTASRAVALASWLRGEGFVYDESAPGGAGSGADSSGDSGGGGGSAMDTVATFLRERRGYCVHYASAFTVMARSLGLPTRIAVGYASAAAGPGRWTEVRGDQLHAWPEVWVEGEGWVAFEPTPGGSGVEADQQGQDTASASPASSPAEATPGQPASQPGTQPPAAEDQDASDVSAPQVGVRASATSVARWGTVAVLVVLLACLLAPGLLRAAAGRRRRQRIRLGRDPAAAAWEELVALGADLRLLGRRPGGRARTHEAVAERLVAALPAPARQSEDADPATGELARREREAVHHLAAGAVAECYGPPAQEETVAGPAAPGRREADERLSTASAGLRSAAGRWRRLLAVVLPASLLPTSTVSRSVSQLVSRLWRRRGTASLGRRGGDADRRAAPARESPEHVRGRERME